MSSVERLSPLVGLTIMIVSEAATLAHVEPFWSWNTPIAWTGFIIFADSVVWRSRHDSWMRSAPREFACLALVSILLWLMFEGYNRIIANWYYTGLPENALLRYFGYAWSFATIWPALFEGAELIAVWRGSGRSGGSGKSGGTGRLGAPDRPDLPDRPAVVSIAVGVVMLASPFFASPGTARFLAAPVWLGFIFLLDPINARLGGQSLFADLRARHHDRVVNLALSGVLCGVLWEFWNYWSHAKWHYTVPIMEHLKVFEMPVPGYLGFPAFAYECFTMYVFVRLAFTKLGRTIAL